MTSQRTGAEERTARSTPGLSVHHTPDVPPARSPRVSRSRAVRVLVAALGGALLFGPWAAGLAGSRSDPVPGENRALAELPAPADASFEELTGVAADRMPLRDAAIRAHGGLTEQLFDERPSYGGGGATAPGAPGAGAPQPGPSAAAPVDQVIEGEQGWLYFFDDFRRACRPDRPLEAVLADVRRMDALLTASGRRFVLAVPPDKSTVDPQFLPEQYVDDACSVAAKAQRWQTLGAPDLDGWVDLRGPLQDQERRTGTPAYLPTDTHWTDRSGALFATQLAAELDPALATGTQVVPDGTRRWSTGDLSAIAQDPQPIAEPGFRVAREGVRTRTTTSALAPGYELTSVRGTSTGAPLFAPRTVLVGDSFSQRALPKVAPYFADMVRVPELTKALLAGNLAVAEQRLRQEIVASDVVVVELVERTFAGAAEGSVFTPAFLDRLEQALAAAPRR